jgi:hypothetical protein
MNERIKELAEQAGFYNMSIGLIIGIEEYHQKFAELIVRECIEQIKTQGISASSEDYGDYEIGFNAGVYHALYTIKQHFGVKE